MEYFQPHNQEKFRLNCKKLFLTWPHTGFTKEQLLAFLTKKLSLYQWYIACQTHADGDPHIHALLSLRKACDIKDDHQLDFKGQHGNYQRAKKWAAVITYLRKEDDNPLTNLTKEEILALTSQAKRAIIGNKLLQGQGIIQVVTQHPQLIFGYSRLQADVSMFRARQAMQADKDKYPDDFEKTRHIWYYGDPNTGKSSTLLRRLGKANCYMGAYPTKDGTEQWPFYQRQKYIIFDQFQGQYTIKRLNQICNTGLIVNMKNGFSYIPMGTIIVVIGIKNISDTYHNVQDRHVGMIELKARFQEFKHVPDPEYKKPQVYEEEE